MIDLIEPEKRAHIESAARDAGASVSQLAQLRVLLEVSPFVAENITKQPDLWPFLLEQVNHANGPTGLAERIARQLEDSPIEDLDRRLRDIRRAEMLRIAWRDVSGLAPTTETLRDLSDLADQCVQQALTAHERVLLARHGIPRSTQGAYQQLVVLGMGKLGGYELNYSSDIDLIFLFEEEGETDGPKSIANSEFFIKLGQRVIRSLNEVTKDGFVFRVDMRLRPHGDEGALALSFDAAELYYTTLGREWERYALIKARVIAGDQAAGARLLELLKPFVYRKYLDFGAFAQLRDMKKAIEREMNRRGMHDNIKLGPGGIREIEFIGQLYQLLRGGREPKLQSRSILATLEVLRGLKELPSAIIDELLSGYDFLRRAENRLQMMHDRQTQTLPLDDLDQARLALAMGYSSWGDFMAALDQHRQRIHQYFGEILQTRRDNADDVPMQQIWLNSLTSEAAQGLLRTQGFDDPELILDTLLAWKRGLSPLISDTVRHRLDLLMPNVLQEVAAHGASAETLHAVLALVDAVLSRSVYLALLIEQPAALKHLVQLCSASPWIAELLRQQPILLDELVDANSLYSQPDVQALLQEIAGFLARFPDDEERQFDELRRFRQLATLRVAAADAMGILPVMRVSDQLTWIAEVVLDKVLQLAYQQMVARHGEPRAVDEHGAEYTPGFAIIAYGKLGGIELGYGSDLDVVFLHDSTDTSAMTTGSKPIENQLFFARLAQKIIHILSIRTPSGVLYEVDTRLRPDGAGGLLVSSLHGFEQYQKQHAWLWETQALCRARFITGQSQIAERFATIRRDALCAPRDPATLKEAVLEMRQKMRTEHGQTGTGETFHLKRGIGGITDIEFMVQYLLLRHAHAHPEIVAHTDNIRQLRALAQAGLLDGERSEQLVSAYQRLRNTSHRRTLNKQSLELPCADFAEERAVVLAAWQQIFEL